MSYQWKKALANAALVFLGCLLAKIPAGDTINFNWPELRHILITCGTITFFAELRYIYSALSKWADGATPTDGGAQGGNMGKIAMLLFMLLVASSTLGQTPAPQPLPGWTFSTSAGFSNVSNAPTNNGFASVTELKLSEYVAIRGDVFILTSPNIIGSYVGPEYVFPATKIFKTNANNPVNASNVEFFVNAKFGDLRSQEANTTDTKAHFSYGFGTGFNIKLSDKVFVRPLDVSYLRGTIGSPSQPFHTVLGNHMQLAALLGVRF